MKNIDKIRTMTPEELTEWLMTDWEQVKRLSTQTYTGTIDWLNRGAKICPRCLKLISTYGIIKFGIDLDSVYEICPHCYKSSGMEVKIERMKDDKT